MSEQRNFSDYKINDNVYGLADGLLPEMARGFGVQITEAPDEHDLEMFVHEVGPAKFMQDNIGLVQQRIGSNANATELAADWVERSGVLLPTRRSFASQETAFPNDFEVAFIPGGVARWMLRRVATITSEVENGTHIETVYLPIGNREMRETEHSLVSDFANLHGKLPTERDFAAKYIVSAIRKAGPQVELFDQDTSVGDDIMAQFAREISDKESVLAISNAPAAIQTAGQFRIAARVIDAGFDKAGDQLFVLADGIDVARGGEGPATHQNPFTALGQVARSALFLYRNQA